MSVRFGQLRVPRGRSRAREQLHTTYDTGARIFPVRLGARLYVALSDLVKCRLAAGPRGALAAGVPRPPVEPAEATADTVSASGAGLVLAGALASPDAELRDLTASFSGCGGWPDQWTLARACGRPEYEVVAHIVLGPVTAPNQIPPLVPIRVCQVQVVDDPLGQYADVSRPSELHVTITVSLPLKPGFYPPFTPYPGPKPTDMYYPCQVLILTTGGARLITIPPPPPPIEDPLEQIASSSGDSSTVRSTIRSGITSICSTRNG